MTRHTQPSWRFPTCRRTTTARSSTHPTTAQPSPKASLRSSRCSTQHHHSAPLELTRRQTFPSPSQPCLQHVTTPCPSPSLYTPCSARVHLHIRNPSTKGMDCPLGTRTHGCCWWGLPAHRAQTLDSPLFDASGSNRAAAVPVHPAIVETQSEGRAAEAKGKRSVPSWHPHHRAHRPRQTRGWPGRVAPPPRAH
jgi:hypothetical protein